MKYYAVLDTKVIVSAMLSKNDDAATVQVMNMVLRGDVVSLYSKDTIAEYREVLARSKFKFDTNLTEYLISAIEKFGIQVTPSSTGKILPDMDDLPFYEIAMEKIDCNPYLITGNTRLFTNESFVVSPAEFLKLIGE